MPLLQAKRPSMPPPGKKPEAVIAIGIGKPERAPMGGDRPQGAEEVGEGAEAKASPDRAIVIRAGEHCEHCQNYEPGSRSCKEVDGEFDPGDACWTYFEPQGQSEESEMPESPGAAPMEAPMSR